jgi:hypothetical protein
MENAIYINVTFGNGTAYDEQEKEHSIETSICLRILYQNQIDNLGTSFDKYVPTYKSENLHLSDVIRKLATEVGSSCIVLGINKVHAIDSNQLKAIFNLVGAKSCLPSPFFIPVIAGTVIGPMNSILSVSTHRPLHIPLPLLSFESSLDIIRKKAPR